MMKLLQKRFWIPFLILILLVISFTVFRGMNRYQSEGTLTIQGLKEPVKVFRDEKGMPYIYAGNPEDALLALGFVTAQDRLFQMELFKLMATGRISELIGEKGEQTDIRMRTIGFHRQAKKLSAILTPQTKLFFQKYLDGVNIYIKNFPQEHPWEFKLAGIQPGLWNVTDSLALLYFTSWNSCANLETEMIAQMLVEKVGLEKAREIFPLNVNPDDSPRKSTSFPAGISEIFPLNLEADAKILSYLEGRPLQLGSNNWAAGPQLSPSGKPIVANDPHLDARILPGPWYPCGLLTPEFRMVGAGVPGIPGMIVGRNAHIAVGVTNAYGDTQDLYVETIDPTNPDNYVEGARAVPFQVVTETLAIKDKNSPSGKKEKPIQIKMTKRGPVVSGVLAGMESNRVLTLRWSLFEDMNPSLGIDGLMKAKSIDDVRRALDDMDVLVLNFVFADQAGNIGWKVSGKLPIRRQGDGTVPFVVRDGQDNWTGWISADKMPQLYNPPRGWVGTCNHYTVNRDYPYYYTSHASPSYRYRRLHQLLDPPGKRSPDEHWQFQRDTMNLMAKEIVPLMVQALIAHEDTRAIADILSKWDFQDLPDQAPPTIFQAVYREFALLVFQDELGPKLANMLLKNWYFWQERLQQMVREGTSPWFDNLNTPDIRETRDELFHQAGLIADRKLRSIFGKDPKQWYWGKVHTLDFVSPIRQEGIGMGLLGGGSHPFPGSGETLCRGIYDFTSPFAAATTASLRMVADLSDDEKVMAVLPGGMTGRFFHPHYKDQIKAFMNGEKLYWWFSDKAIQEHRKTTLFLHPK